MHCLRSFDVETFRPGATALPFTALAPVGTSSLEAGRWPQMAVFADGLSARKLRKMQLSVWQLLNMPKAECIAKYQRLIYIDLGLCRKIIWNT